MMRKVSYIVLSMLVAAAPLCLAQSPISTKNSIPTEGFSSYTSYEQTHDSASNWSSVLDQSVGFDFNKMFGMSVGVPFYLSYNQLTTSTTSTTGKTGGSTQTTSLTSGNNAMGDARVGLRFSSPTPLVRYVAIVTGTVPTGSTSSGISTGRVTADFNNHVEFDLGPLTPMAEVGIANSNALINTLSKRPYTTLGAMPHFKGGISAPLGKFVSVEFDGYENLAVGAQKLYSHLFAKRTAPTTGTSGSTNYKQSSSTSGTGIDTDNGFSTGISTTIRQRMDMGFTYDHSVAQKLDTVSFNIGFRIGKPASK